MVRKREDGEVGVGTARGGMAQATVGAPAKQRRTDRHSHSSGAQPVKARQCVTRGLELPSAALKRRPTPSGAWRSVAPHPRQRRPLEPSPMEVPGGKVVKLVRRDDYGVRRDGGLGVVTWVPKWPRAAGCPVRAFGTQGRRAPAR